MPLIQAQVEPGSRREPPRLGEGGEVGSIRPADLLPRVSIEVGYNRRWLTKVVYWKGKLVGWNVDALLRRGQSHDRILARINAPRKSGPFRRATTVSAIRIGRIVLLKWILRSDYEPERDRALELKAAWLEDACELVVPSSRPTARMWGRLRAQDMSSC